MTPDQAILLLAYADALDALAQEVLDTCFENLSDPDVARSESVRIVKSAALGLGLPFAWVAESVAVRVKEATKIINEETARLRGGAGE